MPTAITRTAATLNVTGYSTAGTILNRVSRQCGLGTRTDPYDGVDENFAQLVEFLNTLGESLTIDNTWSHLCDEGSFTTNGVETKYTVPANFHAFVDQSGWNRDTAFPLMGPVSPQETQFLKAQSSNILVNVAFRLQGGTLVLPVVPSSGYDVAFEYQSTYWVATQAGGSATADAASATDKDDVILHDALPMVLGVKLKFLEAKGFDTGVVARDYERALDHYVAKNAGAPVLSLGGGDGYTERFLNGDNVPQGSW